MRKSGLTGDEAYILSKHGKTTEDFGPLKKEIGKIKEDLSNKITKFYASNQGEVHIADSDNGKIQDMMLYGKSSQFTTTGKNLANGQNINCFINSAADTCGISSNDIGMVIDVSKLTNVSISTRSIQDRYRFACANTVPTKENPITCYNGTSKDGTKVSYTMDTTGYNYLFINATKLEDIQVEKGSESTSYEPYTGGIPSPSPDYPQEIKSVVNPTVKVCGKNLLPFPYSNTSKTQNGVTFDVQNDGTIHIYGTASAATYFNFSTNIEWGSEDFSNTNEKYKLVGNLFYNANNKILSYVVQEGVTCDFILKPMVVLNTETDLTYEPYHEQTVTLPYTLNAIPVSSGGNVTINGQQYIADYVDVERGKLVRMVGEYEITGNEDWTFTAVEPCPKVYFTIKDMSANDKLNVMCDKLKNVLFADVNRLKGYTICSDSNPWIRIYCTSWTSVDEAKNDLKKWKPQVQYVLATPVGIALTTEEIAALKELATYYPVTNISVNSEQLDGYTVFNYPISMENGWNYVKQQLNDNRDYIYDMDTQSAEAYVNSAYAVALTELEV